MTLQWAIRKTTILFQYSPVKIGWHSWMTICLDRPLNLVRYSTLLHYKKRTPTCITLLEWIRSDTFPPWSEVKSLCPELRFLWHHRNNLSVDTNGVLWRKRSSQISQLQLLVPKPDREGLFLSYHATLIGGHLGRNCTLARLSHRFYWSGMADDVGDWLRNCTTCLKRKSPAGRHHPLGNIPTGHLLRTDSDTSLSSPITSASGPRHFQLKTNVQILWRKYWWIKLFWDSECPSWYIAIREGSSKMDWWSRCAPYWDV